MKAILKFDLSDPDDLIDFNQCTKANDMASVLWELCLNSKKSFTKYKVGEEEAYYKAAYEIFDHIHDLLEQHDINIDKLFI